MALKGPHKANTILHKTTRHSIPDRVCSISRHHNRTTAADLEADSGAGLEVVAVDTSRIYTGMPASKALVGAKTIVRAT
jgi:hypothetical protein